MTSSTQPSYGLFELLEDLGWTRAHLEVLAMPRQRAGRSIHPGIEAALDKLARCYGITDRCAGCPTEAELQRLDLKLLEPQILVLTPTRELAIQVAEAFAKYAHHLKNFHVLPIYGGQSMVVQLRQLSRGAQIIVGTPGRVMDHLERESLKLDALKAIAAAGTQKITLMHVQDRTRLDPYMMHMIKQFEETDTVRLNNMKAELAKVSDAAVETLITFGNPSRDILKEIKNNNYQLVVIGSQGRGYVSDFLVGSVGHNIARQSESSGLLIPATAE